MLIGFDGSRAFLKEKTGTENYSYNLLVNLAKFDTENNYLVYIRPGYQLKKEHWPSNFRFKVINFPRFWTQLGLALATFRDKIDILFVSAHTIPLLRKPNLPTIMTIHDLGSEYLPFSHQLKQILYLKFITKFQLKSATKLIAVSEATKQDLIEKELINPKNIEVVYEGVDKDRFKPTRVDLLVNRLNKFDIKKGEYFLFVGTIQPRKNLERLIRAFALINRGPVANLKLALAGSRGWLSADIYKLPKKLGIDDRVKFLGRVQDADLVALYKGAKALVFPSLFEGFGLPILEAFASNCPVLTSNLSSMKEIAKDAALLVDPYDENSIASGLTEITTKDIANKLVKKGEGRVKQFSWEKTAAETLKVIKDI